jgi:spore germination protein GerM
MALAAALGVTALLASACGIPYSATPQALGVPLPAQLTNPTVATPAKSSGAAPSKGVPVSFYYIKGPLSLLTPLFPPQEVAAPVTLSAVLRILETGPPSADQGAGATTAFPPGSDIRALPTVRRVAHIELDQQYETAGLQEAVLELGQIVYTVLGTPSLGLKAVQFYFDGSPIQVVNGNGGLVSGTVNEATYCVKAVSGCPKLPNQRPRSPG